MHGEITNGPYVQASCKNGHSVKMYPREGKYTFMFWHAVDALENGLLYEAASSSYAALEDFMKTYVIASAYQKSGNPKNILQQYKDFMGAKFLTHNSTRIIGAYAYNLQLNTGVALNARKFEKMSNVRDSIIHAASIPEKESVEKLIVSIYNHMMENTLQWIYRPSGNQPRQPFLPRYKFDLATSMLSADQPELDEQQFINSLQQTPIQFVFDSCAFDETVDVSAVTEQYRLSNFRELEKLRMHLYANN